MPAISRVIAILALCASPILAQAEEQPLWKEVGTWSIHVDTTLENSCFAVNKWETNVVLRIGFDMTEKSFHVFIGKDDWKSLEYGKEYDLEIKFGSKSPWDVLATGKTIGDGGIFLYFSSDKTEFLDEFMKQRDMRVSYLGTQIAHLNLAQSYAAFQEVINCQTAMNESAASNDPFRQSKPAAIDPFAN